MESTEVCAEQCRFRSGCIIRRSVVVAVPNVPEAMTPPPAAAAARPPHLAEGGLAPSSTGEAVEDATNNTTSQPAPHGPATSSQPAALPAVPSRSCYSRGTCKPCRPPTLEATGESVAGMARMQKKHSTVILLIQV